MKVSHKTRLRRDVPGHGITKTQQAIGLPEPVSVYTRISISTSVNLANSNNQSMACLVIGSMVQ